MKNITHYPEYIDLTETFIKDLASGVTLHDALEGFAYNVIDFAEEQAVEETSEPETTHVRDGLWLLSARVQQLEKRIEELELPKTSYGVSMPSHVFPEWRFTTTTYDEAADKSKQMRKD